MTAPAIDESVPDFGNDVDDDVDKMRENTIYLLTMAAAAAYMLPAWTTTVQGTDKAEPDSITMTHSDSRGMRFQFTWTSGNVTQINYQFDKGLGSGYEEILLGTLAIAFDGDGNFTGATPS